MPDNSIYPVTKLLLPSDGNTKLVKNNSNGKYITFGLSLAPHKTSGHNTCPKSTHGCRQSCIFTAGYAMVFPKTVQTARIARTRALFQDRAGFKRVLLTDLKLANWRAKQENKKLCVRLNVFSDIVWEKLFPEIFTDFPDVQYYDYTKLINRMFDTNFPKNYYLTFSKSENNIDDVNKVLEAGKNAAVIFDITRQKWKKQKPKEWNGYEVIDGDLNDLRFLDKQGVVVGLYAKGEGRRDKTGFVEKTKTSLLLV